MDQHVDTRECIEAAARLLRAAETETDRTLMQAYDSIADSWINLGRLVSEVERV